MPHLFWEAFPQTGKSTLLRKYLEPYKSKLGGFSSQRLWEDDFPRAYRLVPAGDFQLDANYSPDMENVFRYHREKHPEVFRNYGTSLLRDASNHPLALLDEIGGAELLVPEFRTELYNLLRSDTPCIGVLKLSDKARFMQKTAGYTEDVISYNEQLRDFLKSLPDCRLVTFDRDNPEEAITAIEDFLERIF